MRTFDNPSDVLTRTRLVERFLDYVRFDTQSDETSTTCPSTAKQLELGRRLVDELKELGLTGVGEAEVTMDQNWYVLAELPTKDGAKDRGRSLRLERASVGGNNERAPLTTGQCLGYELFAD